MAGLLCPVPSTGFQCPHPPESIYKPSSRGCLLVGASQQTHPLWKSSPQTKVPEVPTLTQHCDWLARQQHLHNQLGVLFLEMWNASCLNFSPLTSKIHHLVMSGQAYWKALSILQYASVFVIKSQSSTCKILGHVNSRICHWLNYPVWYSFLLFIISASIRVLG